MVRCEELFYSEETIRGLALSRVFRALELPSDELVPQLHTIPRQNISRKSASRFDFKQWTDEDKIFLERIPSDQMKAFGY